MWLSRLVTVTGGAGGSAHGLRRRQGGESQAKQDYCTADLLAATPLTQNETRNDALLRPDYLLASLPVRQPRHAVPRGMVSCVWTLFVLCFATLFATIACGPE